MWGDVPELRPEVVGYGVEDGDALVGEEADGGVRLVRLHRGLILEEDLELYPRAR